MRVSFCGIPIPLKYPHFSLFSCLCSQKCSHTTVCGLGGWGTKWLSLLSSKISVERLHLLTSLSLHLPRFHSGGANYCCIKTLQQWKQQHLMEGKHQGFLSRNLQCHAEQPQLKTVKSLLLKKQRGFFSISQLSVLLLHTAASVSFACSEFTPGIIKAKPFLGIWS